MINVCLASRGRPYLLNRVLHHADVRVEDPDDVVFSVALDEDDPTLMEPPRGLRCRLVWNVAPREDTLGAKYNRAQRLAPDADLFLSMSDDMLLDNKGWDEGCRRAAFYYADKVGVAYCGRHPEHGMPGHILATRRWIELAGEFFCELFPYWFLDPWLHEIASMAGRVVIHNSDKFVSRPIGVKHKTRGLREVTFWQHYFTTLRPEREAIADRIIDGLYDPADRQVIRAMRPALIKSFESIDAFLLDPVMAAQIEDAYAEDAPADLRYNRVKALARERLTAELRREAA